MMGWRGNYSMKFNLITTGPHYSEYEKNTALRTLWKYLTDSAVSPLYQVFVEIEEPLCTDIYTGTLENSELCHVSQVLHNY
jgi:Zn-dependent M16 (insulinase) family peptidase